MLFTTSISHIYSHSEKPQHITEARNFDSSVNGSKAAEWKEHSLALDTGKSGDSLI